jgi:hypothetical protein
MTSFYCNDLVLLHVFYGGRMTLLASAMEPRVRRAYRVRGADSMLHVTRFTDGHEWHVPSSNRFLD